MNLDQRQVELSRSRTPRSKELWEKTKELIPTGHGGGMAAFKPHPIVIDHAEGCWLWDVDGNRYLDLRIGDWVNIHGHCDPDIARAVGEQMTKLVQVGAPEWDRGYRMASLLVERTPSIEKVRFFVSGTDANLAAIRIARAKTGRDKVAKSLGGYHGIADVLTAGTSLFRDPEQFAPPGVPAHAAADVVEIPFNDLAGTEEVLDRRGEELAAVLVEPVMTSAGMMPADPEYLRRLRELTEAKGIVLIFDEVVTFPIAYGGGQAHFGVVPDLTTLGKAIGGGLPASAVGGRTEFMELLDPDAFGGTAPLDMMATFGGNSAALSAGITCLEKLTPAAHERLSGLGERTRTRINALAGDLGVPLQATGLGHLVGLHWAEEPVVDYRTRLLDDREKIANINLALDNAGYYQTFVGLFFLSTAIGEQELDGFLGALERCLHDLGYVA